MIDFTTIQTSPIPPQILELQEQNLVLENRNQFLKNLILGISVVAFLLLINQLTSNAKPTDIQEV